MAEDVGVVTSGSFAGVGTDGQAVEGVLGVDGRGEFHDDTLLPPELWHRYRCLNLLPGHPGGSA